MRLTFENRYGKLTLALVTGVVHVNNIHGKVIDKINKFDLATAEKIALITDNRGIQIGGLGAHDNYVVVHETPDMAAVARVEHIEYVGGNPAFEIQKARRDVVL